MNLNELKYKAAEFSDKTFGRDNPPTASIRKLRGEVDELLECFEKGDDPSEEFADCFLLLIDAYRKHFGDDIDLQKLIDDSSDKLDVVSTRSWGEPDEHGVFQHIKEEEDDGDPYDLSVHSAGSDYYHPDVLDINKIERIYDEISLDFAFATTSPDTLNKIKKIFQEKLPEYNVQCDDKNNTLESRNAGQIWIRVTHPRNENYIDVVL